MDIVVFVQKTIKDRREHILDVLEHNGIQDMGQYASLMGELTALNLVQQELLGLLEKQEHIND
jgi:hypothetical protein|tara:strand:+ start:3420 stop:3608 length:189 start_codon:yes stop_codon:yes gene_type:complete